MRIRSDTILTGALMLAEIGVLLVAQRRSPARIPREPGAARLVRNGVLDGLALAATGLIETPIVMRVAVIADRRGWGLLPRMKLPALARTLVTIGLLDYAMYAWHSALHRIPVLWRLHLVHHADRDLDVTTALRIHIVENLVSVIVRIAQVVGIGATRADFALWQRLFASCVLFEHANIRLPDVIERIVSRVIVTPRLHAIHHLARRDAQLGNCSSGLVLWDMLHGTLRDGDPAQTVGVPYYDRPSDVTLPRMLALPFIAQPDPWRSR
jgi:sterol desaturase/sphingolipid hydroxylase (fatty acid hydroxylase superfamily)